MSADSQHLYEFGHFRIDPGERVLLRGQEVVPLTPKVFEILLVLVQNSGQVVSKDGLMKKVWPDSFVEDGNLTQNISLLRKALGEGQNGHQYIETVARRGYRFVAPVRDAGAGDGSSAGAIGTHDPRAIETSPAGEAAPVLQTAPQKYSIQSLKTRRQVLMLSVPVLIAVALGIVYLTRDSKAVNSGAIESIAVLP